MIEIIKNSIYDKSNSIHIKENEVEFNIKTGNQVEFDLIESIAIKRIKGDKNSS